MPPHLAIPFSIAFADIPFYCLMFFAVYCSFYNTNRNCHPFAQFVVLAATSSTHHPQCKITHHPQCHAHWLLRVCMCAAHLLVLLFASIFMLGYTNAVETISLISFPLLTCFFCLLFLFAANPQFSIFFFFALVCQSNGKKQNPRKKSIPNFASIPTSTPYIHMYIHPPRTHTKLDCERNEAEIR